MCNAYNLKTNLSAIADAALRQLGLPVVVGGGVTPSTSNMPVPPDLYPKKDGLFLRPVEGGLEPVVGRWGLVPWSHKGSLKAVKFPCNNCRSETMATSGLSRKRRRAAGA